jgi:hypothetical protein
MTLKEKVCEPFDGLKKETADKLLKIADDYAIEFNSWMKKVDTQENAEKWFGYTDRDMLNIFKKEKGL